MNRNIFSIFLLTIFSLTQAKAQTIEDLYLKKNYKEVMKEMGKDDKYYKEADKKAQKEFAATLSQNIPNPFTNNTRIDIYLPGTVKNANLYVYNMQGVQIKSFNINERGNTSVTIEGFSLHAGMYLYTLIADGKEVDTKKMILTK